MLRARPTARLGLILTLSGACGDSAAGPADSEDGSGGTTGGPIIKDNETSTGEPDTDGEGEGETDPGETGGASETASTLAADTGDSGDDTTTGVEPCEAPSTLPCDHANKDIYNAIGLHCQDDPSKAIPIEDPVLKAPDSGSFRVATRFGTAQDPDDPDRPAWAPREGERFLVIGTGQFPQPDKDTGSLSEDDDEDSDSNKNPDNREQLPGVIERAYGSNNGAGGTPFVDCDGLHDCSDTLQPQWELTPGGVAHDVFYMAFDVTAPAGTHGYKLDFVVFSEEWPVFVDTVYNDMFVVWSTSESFTGNITFIDGTPLTVTSLDPFMVVQPGDDRLEGTGFPGDDEGAATEWMTVSGSAQPGETFTVAIAIFDMGDVLWDSVALVDNFRWDCAGCLPAPADGCGVGPA